MRKEPRLRNLHLEAVWLLLRGDWTVTEMMEKIGLKERTSLCLALRRLETHGIARIKEKRSGAPVWELVQPWT